jgi:Uma2 family endonuclease
MKVDILLSMSTLDLTPFLKSPLLPDVAAALNERLRIETIARERFYDEMSDAQKVEFIGGEVIMHSPARNQHLVAKANLTALLMIYVRHHQIGEVRDEKCLCVFPRNDYEPDIVFFAPKKAATFHPETMKFPVPDFVVEVLSDSTEARDRGIKFEDYEAHGVSEYWVIDAESEIVEQFVLVDGTFQLRLKSGSGEIASQIIAGFRIPIQAIFDPNENLATLKRMLK